MIRGILVLLGLLFIGMAAAEAGTMLLLNAGSGTVSSGGGSACGASCTAFVVPGSIVLNPQTSRQWVAPYMGVVNE